MAKPAAADVVRLPQPITITNDGDVAISIGKSRYETEWKNRRISWSALLGRLSTSQETGETHAEYMKMPKEQQDKLKDIGGFVGGYLRDGRRKNGSVSSRQIITLDADFAPRDFWDRAMDLTIEGTDCAMAIYSTHKHSAAKPRLRLIIPLDREVTADEYEAIARKMADKVGIDFFDDSTYQPARLMYWPSHSADVDPVFEYYDAPFLKADEILDEYPDWSDASYWPESSRMVGVRKKMADKQGDPTEKKGIVGAFCRTYTVTQAIEKFLPGVYTPTAKADRWTYAAGSTAGGLVIYDGDIFAYSNHGTDPAGGQLCNAFDLVRIHKFGHLDEGSEDKNGGARPSYKAMEEEALNDRETVVTIALERTKGAQSDFEKPEDADERKKTDWKLQFHRTSARGVPVDIIDSAIADYVKSSSRILMIEREPYVYRDGVYRLDDDEVQVKAAIGRCIFKDLITAGRLDRVYKLLQIEPELQHGVDDLNRHPKSWINCRNGMLDLKTGELHPHDPKYYSLNQVPYEYVPGYEIPQDSITVDFLKAMIPDEDDREMFLEFAGCCMSAYMGFQKYLILSGTGGVGKSVLLEMVTRAVGRENSSAIAIQKLSERFQSRFLQGKLVNVFADLSSEAMEDTSILKMILGEDDIPAEIKGGKVYHFRPYCKLLFSANRIPVSRDEQTSAFYRRLMILPIPEGVRRFEDLKERLEADAQTFFQMAADAAGRAFRRGSLIESATSKKEVRELYLRTDSVIAFLEERTEKAPGERIKTADAYTIYESHCMDQDRPSLSRIAFRSNMREKGIGVRAVHGVEYFCDLRLLGGQGGSSDDSD